MLIMAMASCVPRVIVHGEVYKAQEDLVLVRKQVCVIGHLYVCRLRYFIDAAPLLDRNFGLDMVTTEWLSYSGMWVTDLRECSLEFILDYCPDIVLLQAIDNDMDTFGPIDHLVASHVEFAMEVSSQMGGINVIICGPLHTRTPCYLSMEAYNANVDDCNRILRERLVDPAFTHTKHMDMCSLIVPSVYFWEHRKMKRITQLIGDGVHLIPVGNTRLYYSCRTIVRELTHH